MENWLTKRLVPSKRLTDRWNELAQTLQLFWEVLFDIEFVKLYNMHSIYTADDDGQRRIVADMGNYFEEDLTANNRPISVAMRKLELMLKDTDYPIRMAIQRAGILGVEWVELWALEADGLYGVKFYDKYTGIPNDAYLTSRGVLAIDLAQVTQSNLTKIERLIWKLKPLHIVYAGTTFAATDQYQSFGIITEDLQPLLREDDDRLIIDYFIEPLLFTAEDLQPLLLEDGDRLST